MYQSLGYIKYLQPSCKLGASGVNDLCAFLNNCCVKNAKVLFNLIWKPAICITLYSDMLHKGFYLDVSRIFSGTNFVWWVRLSLISCLFLSGLGYPWTLGIELSEILVEPKNMFLTKFHHFCSGFSVLTCFINQANDLWMWFCYLLWNSNFF